MSERCVKCGAVVPKGSPGGMCPRCCLWGLEEEGEDNFAFTDIDDGLVIPGFEVIRELGSGAFGKVYECLEFEPAVRRVAVKVLKSEMLGASQRLREEIQILAGLEHPAIARLYSSGQLADGRPFYAMEYVGGRDFSTWIREEKPSLRVQVEVLKQIVAALAHAHEQGVVHRDLKPGNLLIKRDKNDWRPKVIDFGVARAIHGVASFGREVTLAETWLGTPSYMSPEQLSGAKQVGPSSDTYSLGLLILEAMFGESASSCSELSGGASWLEYYQARQGWTAGPWPSRVQVSLRHEPGAHELFWIGRKATSWDLDQRYQDGAELELELKAWSEGKRLMASPQRWSARMGSVVKRHRKPLAILCAAIFTIGGFFWSGAHFLRADVSAEFSERVSKTQRSDELVGEASMALAARDIERARFCLREALSIWPENPDARFVQRALECLCREALPLPTLDLPERGVRVWSLGEGRWGVELESGRGIVVDEEGTYELWDAIPESEASMWQGDKPSPWQASRPSLGVLEFRSQAGSLPPLERVEFAPGSGAVDIDSEGMVMAAVDGSAKLRRWDLSELGQNLEIARLDGARWASFEREESTTWAFSSDGTLALWPLRGQIEPILKLPGLVSIRNDLQLQPDHARGLVRGARAMKFVVALGQWQDKKAGRQLLTTGNGRDTDSVIVAASDGALALWNEEERLEELDLRVEGVQSVHLSPLGKKAAILTGDACLELVDVCAERKLSTINFENKITAVSFDSEGRSLAVGTANGEVHFLDLSRQGGPRSVVDLLGGRVGPGKVTLVADHARGTFLVSVEGDRRIRKVVDDGRLVEGFELEHDLGVDCFFPSADGSVIVSLDQASGSLPGFGLVNIWSERTGKKLLPPFVHPGGLVWVGLCPDGHHLATIAKDGVLRRWTLHNPEESEENSGGLEK